METKVTLETRLNTVQTDVAAGLESVTAGSQNLRALHKLIDAQLGLNGAIKELRAACREDESREVATSLGAKQRRILHGPISRLGLTEHRLETLGRLVFIRMRNGCPVEAILGLTTVEQLYQSQGHVPYSRTGFTGLRQAINTALKAQGLPIIGGLESKYFDLLKIPEGIAVLRPREVLQPFRQGVPEEFRVSRETLSLLREPLSTQKALPRALRNELEQICHSRGPSDGVGRRVADGREATLKDLVKLYPQYLAAALGLNPPQDPEQLLEGWHFLRPGSEGKLLPLANFLYSRNIFIGMNLRSVEPSAA